MPGLKTTEYGSGDYSWMLNSRGIRYGMTGVLDISTFTAATHYPEGFVRSGTPVNCADRDVIVPWADPATPPLWAASTAYALGAFVRLSGGATLEVTTAGTSGTTEPAAPAAVGGTVTNGTVTFTRRPAGGGAVLGFVGGDFKTDGVEDLNVHVITHPEGVKLSLLPVPMTVPVTAVQPHILFVTGA